MDYDTKFTQLSCHSLLLVDTEHMRVAILIRGLADQYFIALSLQIGKLTYVESVNAALEIEGGKADRKPIREATKKVKTRVSYSGCPSFSEAPGHQGVQYIPLRGAMLSEPSPISTPTLGSQAGSTFQSNLQSFEYSAPSTPLCQMCGKMYYGLCHRVIGACLWCSQTGHLRRDCPQVPRGKSQGVVPSIAPSSSSFANQP